MIRAAPHADPVPRPRRNPTDVAVAVRHLTKRFPKRRGWTSFIRHPTRRSRITALDDIGLDVERGEFFGLLGPNGAGKTTLFKILATLVLPDRGTATINGHDVREDDARVRQILAPVVSDDRSLYWRLSARENLRLYAGLNRLDRRTTENRIGELLETVGLAEAGAKLVGAYSSGMKQRLLIARALLSRPEVLLLDEPTRSLDPISARRFRQFLREQIGIVQGCTVLLATHNAEEALELCDRLAVLDQGRLIAVGTAAELTRKAGDDRYRAWLKPNERWTCASLGRARSVSHVKVAPTADDGWVQVDLEIAGGPEQVAEVLASWTAAGIPVLQFERVGLTLADLLERLVTDHRESRRRTNRA